MHASVHPRVSLFAWKTELAFFKPRGPRDGTAFASNYSSCCLPSKPSSVPSQSDPWSIRRFPTERTNNQCGSSQPKKKMHGIVPPFRSLLRFLSQRHRRSNQIDQGYPNPLFHGILPPLPPSASFRSRSIPEGSPRGASRGVEIPFPGDDRRSEGGTLVSSRRLIIGTHSSNTRWNAQEHVHPVQKPFEVRQLRFLEEDACLPLSFRANERSRV